MTNMHTVMAWDIVRRLADAEPWDDWSPIWMDAGKLLAQVNTEAELRKALEASEAARRELKTAVQDLLEQCAMTHKHWGQNCNQKQASAAIAKAQALAQV